MDNLQNWKNLQENKYFENHPLYNMNKYDNPHCVDIHDIINKNVAEIGCGYGRETFFFSEYANYVYAIDVSETILNKMDLEEYEHVIPVLAEDYKEKIPDEIDYVYALHVFQHLTLEQTKDYINTFFKKLKKGGKFNAQFYLGTDKYMEEGKEPRICYTKEEALHLFKKYRIEKTWTLNKYKANGELQYTHFYIIGVK